MHNDRIHADLIILYSWDSKFLGIYQWKEIAENVSGNWSMYVIPKQLFLQCFHRAFGYLNLCASHCFRFILTN